MPLIFLNCSRHLSNLRLIKHRCDRQTPCGPCTRAGSARIDSCIYPIDRHYSRTTAPFKATDTSFSVFERDFGHPRSPPRGSSRNVTATPFLDTDDHAQGPEDWVGMPDVSVTVHPQLDEENRSTDNPSRSLSLLRPLTGPALSGAFFKERFYGQSHWMSFMHPVSAYLVV